MSQANPLWVVDISHHQQGINVAQLKREGAAAMIARIGQGAGRRRDGGTYGTTKDREWINHRNQARAAGLLHIGYWYSGNMISPEENARLCDEWRADDTLAVMLDHEDASGDTNLYHRTLQAFAARGIPVVLGYYPKWYWNAVGQGSLVAGPPLVNSAYPGGTGTPAQIWGDGSRHMKNFAGYGGEVVALLQFTNQAAMAGYKIDCSAFLGSTEELHALLTNGDTVITQADAELIANTVWLKTQPHPHTETAPGTGIGVPITPKDALFLANDAAQRTETLAKAEFEKLSDDEANIIAAINQASSGPELDTNALANAIAAVLAPLVDNGASTQEIQDAVDEGLRRAFTRAADPE